MESESLAKVESDFRKSIRIPYEKARHQFLLCPVGLVGSGKTTVIQPISEAFSLVRISSDELRKMLKEAGHTYASVKEIGLRAIKEIASQGHGIAFDMDCGNPQVKGFAEKLANELNIKIFFLHITAPEEFIFDKFRKHPPTWLADNPQTMIDNHIAQKNTRLKENTPFDFFFSFDTSRPDLSDQISECCDKIRMALNG